MKGIDMKRYLVFLFASLALTTQAQNDSLSDAMRRRYEQFRQQAHQRYDDFRQKANKEYAQFMRLAWQRYQAKPALPQPKEDSPVPPTVYPEEDIKDDKPKDNPRPIEEVIPVPKSLPQPKPVAPIPEVPVEKEDYFSFTFWGTDGKVRMGEKNMFRMQDCSPEQTALAWDFCSGTQFDNLIRDCLEIRIRHNLCDWAYMQMIKNLSESFLGKDTNEAVLLMAYLYCQSGYKMRLATSGTRLYMLYASRYTIYKHTYFDIDGESFYILDGNETQLQIFTATFPSEQSMDLNISKAQRFGNDYSPKRMLKSERYPEMQVEITVNKNLMDFYDKYPSSDYGNNFMTRWAIYANTPLEETLRQDLYAQLKRIIGGKSQLDAANILINWVQTAFVYEFDDVVWGHDRAFFAEETLYYPYCDCEDRSILFSRLVRDLLGLKVVLVYYPGHLATAVCFTEEVQGDYIALDGKRFVICDPTFIGAPVGHTMTDMDNGTAKVILLE